MTVPVCEHGEQGQHEYLHNGALRRTCPGPPVVPLPEQPAENEQRFRGVRVTAEDIATESDGTVVIYHDYCLITAGDCAQTYVQVSACKDGSETHVVTIKGVRKGWRPVEEVPGV